MLWPPVSRARPARVQSSFPSAYLRTLVYPIAARWFAAPRSCRRQCSSSRSLSRRTCRGGGPEPCRRPPRSGRELRRGGGPARSARRAGRSPRAESLRIGTAWLGLTVAFEFAFGRLVAKQSWRDLLADYNLAADRMWPLVLAWIGAGPTVVRKLPNGGPAASLALAGHGRKPAWAPARRRTSVT